MMRAKPLDQAVPGPGGQFGKGAFIYARLA